MSGLPLLDPVVRIASVRAATFTVVIPAFNESARLPETLALLEMHQARLGLSVEVIVVDDGSRDDTVRRSLLTPAVRVLRLPANCGKGFAVRAGLLAAAGDFVLMMDADGSTPLIELPRLLEGLARTGADIAIGSRMMQPATVEAGRKSAGLTTAPSDAASSDAPRIVVRRDRHLLGRLFHQVVRVLGPSGIRDTQCGFKLFRTVVAQELCRFMHSDGFAFDVELLLLAEQHGYTVVEVPVSWEHRDGSKVRVALDGPLMVADLCRIRLRWLCGHYDRPRLGPALPARSPRSTATATTAYRRD